MGSPSPDEIRAERDRAGWDKETAATAVCASLRSWQAYEAVCRQSKHHNPRR